MIFKLISSKPLNVPDRSMTFVNTSFFDAALQVSFLDRVDASLHVAGRAIRLGNNDTASENDDPQCTYRASAASSVRELDDRSQLRAPCNHEAVVPDFRRHGGSKRG